MAESRKTVTALRERPRGRVGIELDGVPWRTLPTDAVVRVGLRVGRMLDRETARALARERRTSEALARAARVLRHRDLSRRALSERLPAAAREAALETLERSGLVDDARAAAGRAASLAGRGWGDEAIRFRLEREGFDGEPLGAALAGLDPEWERAAALRARGKSERWLAGRGFGGVAPEA